MPKFSLHERVLYGSDAATGFKEGDNVFFDGWQRGTVSRVNKDGTIRFKIRGSETGDVSPERFQAVEGTITEVEEPELDDDKPLFGHFLAYKVKPDNTRIEPMIVRENELRRPPPRRSARRLNEPGSATRVWGSH
jgi:hypothetical protein